MVQGRKTSLTVQVTLAEKRVLESYGRSTTISAGLYRRGRIILLLADGASVSETARLVGVRRRNVYKWAERFLQAGPNGLAEKPGRGRISKSAMASAGMPGHPEPNLFEPSLQKTQGPNSHHLGWKEWIENDV